MKCIKTVLIVDDNEEVGYQLVELFQNNGFMVGLASDGSSAIDAFNDREIDVVITDLLLPDMSGVSLVKKLKAISPDLEILVMTNFTNENLITESLLNGASAFISKPINPKQVILLTLKCLEKRWLRKECSRLMLELAIKENKLNEIIEKCENNIKFNLMKH